MASLSRIHHTIARLQAVSSPPLPPELICIGPLRCSLERKFQAHAHFKKLPTSSIHSAVRSKLLFFATTAGQDTATSTLVLQEVDFVWKGEGSQVLLTGDFLDWDAKVSLSKGADGAFHCQQKLAPGTYKYKYIIDGEWTHSPDSPTIEDGRGGFNNQIIVTDASPASANLPKSQQSADGASPTVSAKATADADAAAKVSAAVEGSPKAASKPEETPPTVNAKATADAGAAAKVSAAAEGSPKAASKPEDASPTASAKATADVGAAAKVSAAIEGSSKAASKPEDASPTASAKATADAGAAAKVSAAAEGSPKAASKPASAGKPAKKVPVAKPYPQLITEDVIPKIESKLRKEQDISNVNLVFQDNQLEGSFVKNGIIYTFWVFFPDGKLEGSRGFSLSSHGAPPSTVEPFLIDEKKITADLLVFWVMKRLFVQNLLSLN